MEYVKLYHISSDYLLCKIDTKIIIEDSNIQSLIIKSKQYPALLLTFKE